MPQPRHLAPTSLFYELFVYYLQIQGQADKIKADEKERTSLMKKSIRIQFVITTVALLAGTIILSFLVNNIFLEDYYVLQKNRIVQQAYEKINAASNGGVLQTKEFQEEMRDYAFRYDTNAIVINSNSEVVLLASFDGEELNRRLLSYIFRVPMMEGGELQMMPAPDTLFHGKGFKGKTEQIELYGQLDTGEWYIISSPLESIRDSVKISSRFLIYIAIAGICVGIIITWVVSGKFTKPILELADISERMTRLDFEAKYSGAQHNEIALLGNNINKLSTSLEKTISELKTANNELKKDIEKKEEIDEMRKEFLANVSHELKTPIALIQGYAEGLKEGIDDDAETREYYVDVIMDEAAKMDNMVKKLLTLNQLEFGKDMVNMERFDIVELVRNYVQSAEILTKAGDIQVRITDSEPLYVWGDEFKVEEVVMNFFTNAVNHCAGKRIIDIQFSVEDGKIKTGIFNTGSPIPEDALPHIWDKFYKVDKARTREYGGSGVGLSIVKAIMESMNQSYGVENYTNGVKFYFTLEQVQE